MSRQERRGFELAARIQEQADYLLVRGSTGPLIANILTEYAEQIRSAPDPDSITERTWFREVDKLIMDLTAAKAFVERW